MMGMDPAKDVDPAERLLRHRAKASLRKRMRGMRALLTEDTAGQRSNAIVDRLLASDVLTQAQQVALFWPMLERKEVDLRRLDTALRARAVQVAYPFLEADPETAPEAVPRRMTFRIASPDDLAERGSGFAEPCPEAPLMRQPDVVIVPALAADPRGHRLGYGAGYYDRCLAELQALNPELVTVTVIYDFQLVADLPNTEGDVPTRSICTDQRWLDCSL